MRLTSLASLVLLAGLSACTGDIKSEGGGDNRPGNDSAGDTSSGSGTDSGDTSSDSGTDSGDTAQVAEDCANDADDDADGAVDCDDSDCEGADACIAARCWDEDLADATGIAVATGSTVGAGDDVLPSCDPTDATAEDRTYLWTAPTDGDWRISTAGSGFATAIVLLNNDCGGEELVCGEDVLERGFTAGEQVVIGVDGFGGASGDYVLNIVPAGTTESDCTNGDDDVDGLADCEDPDCATELLCVPESDCGNAADDDLDGLADCLDTDCATDARCLPETDCTDLTDNDADGAIDCDDSDCATDARCVPETDCADLTDNDADGAIDCDDSDCATDARCVPESDCADLTDNDADGAIDCDDSDCAPTSTCLATCLEVTDLGSALGEALASGTTVGAGNDLAGSCGGSSAEDVALTWTAPYDDTFTFSTDGSSFDTILVVGTGDCAGLTELDCNDDDGEGSRSLIAATLSAGDIVLLDVDGYSTNSGAFQINVYASAERDCTDGVDEDGDGAVDCDDSDCDASCPEDACGDGVDDDTDGFTDCDDVDCVASAICLEETDCNDGLDDDADGFTDCDDPSCADDATCIATACYDDALGDVYGNDFATVALDGDDVTTSCGYGGDDAFVTWTAPATATWTISATADSSFDYITLEAASGDCASLTSLGCEETYPYYEGDPSVTLALVAGDIVGLAVESAYGYAASATLTAWADTEFDCFDGLDNDGDAAADCEDAACGSVCPETLCGDSLDNDADGSADCADADCVTEPICSLEADCTDGLDDDGDGFTDCADPACADTTECLAFACVDNDIGSDVGPAVFSGTSLGAGNEFNRCGTSSSVEDRVVSWTAPASGSFTFDTEGSATSDTYLIAVSGGCVSPTYLECDDDDGTGNWSSMTRTVTEGDVVFLALEAYSGTGSVTLNITPEFEFDCADGVDDDGDVAVDCDDSDCASACFELDCRDGLDGESDGYTDCDDSECATDVTCVPETACTDGLDGDLDGLTDCSDSDCAADFACGSTCFDGTLASPLGYAVASGTNVGAGDDRAPSCTSGGDPSSDDVAYVWTAPAADTYTFSLAGSTYDTVLTIEEAACATTELGCNDDSGGVRSEVSVALAAGEQVIVNVDGYDGEFGSYVLSIYASTELSCTDGGDDDGDGSTDCADSDCASDASCIETACADRADDEGDGLIDCLDTDCATSTSCTSTVADYVLGSVTSGTSSGAAVATGSTLSASATFSASCASSSTARDLAYLWVAPSTRTWTFDLSGSSYDTAMSLRDRAGTQFSGACDDDSGTGSTSLLTRTVNAGEAILVVVDGYGASESGSFQLRIY